MPKGEARLLLEQLKQISSDILENLNGIDEQLFELQQSIKYGEPEDKDNVIERINEIRYTIGAMEREDTHGLEEETILMDLIKKLDQLIDSIMDTE